MSKKVYDVAKIKKLSINLEKRSGLKNATVDNVEETLGMVASISGGKLVELCDVRMQLGRFYPNFAAMKEIILYQTKQLSFSRRRRYAFNIANLEMPPLGSRVRRGPDWQWGNQDSCGVVTVTTTHYKSGWLRVVWDNGSGYPYRFGADEAIDIVFVDEPRIVKDKKTINVGYFVTRGPDWKWNNQDGCEGCIGTVYFIHNQEVFFIWQWKDKNGKWNSYTTEANDVIEKGFEKGSSCVLVSINGGRVAVKKGFQINIATQDRFDILRITK